MLLNPSMPASVYCTDLLLHTPHAHHTHTHTTPNTHTQHTHTTHSTHTPHTHTPHTHTTHTVGFLWTCDQHVAEAATYRKHTKQKRQTSMPPAGLEPAIPGTERPQTYG